ncbi:MAG TPA: 2-oxo-4-hydroxy-4-carboxy-5-ureidoimidazoline decarboxylase [Candidatus Angelobacter sp.]
MITIKQLNSLSRDHFLTAIAWVFEHSPWVAERAWAQRPFRDLNDLHDVMIQEVERASQEQKLALLCAHPDLGTRARISEASTGEQSGAGLDRLTLEEYRRLQDLNTAYREKFGFPFIYAVKGSNKYDILRALEQRLETAPEGELREALEQVYRIAWFRLREAISS